MHDQIQPEAARMIKDPSYKFFDFEGEFNKAGYAMLSEEQFEEALFIFKMNTDLFPESANAWDSLAEAYWKSGDTIKAVEFYNKAIALDAEGPIGDHAREMLQTMEASTPKE